MHSFIDKWIFKTYLQQVSLQVYNLKVCQVENQLLLISYYLKVSTICSNFLVDVS
jgi:hypothetical protein